MSLNGSSADPCEGFEVRLNPCPCCGRLTIDEIGAYEICDVCGWEDDATQLRWPTLTGGANGLSLVQCQRNYERIGACEEASLRHVRPAREDEPLDHGWYAIAGSMLERFEPLATPSSRRKPWPRDLAQLYWWRSTFWDPMKWSQRQQSGG